MKDYFHEVLGEFRRYGILFADFKTAHTNPLPLTPMKGGHMTEHGISALSHPDPYTGLEFHIVTKPLMPGDYEIKIFWREIENRPVFRFESSGDGHINRPKNGCPLPLRKIPTPHFHKIDDDGRMRAYRTAFLEDAIQEEKVQSHYSVGLDHFCQEAKIQDANGGKIIVTTISSPLGLSTSNDPHEGVTF